MRALGEYVCPGLRFVYAHVIIETTDKICYDDRPEESIACDTIEYLKRNHEPKEAEFEGYLTTLGVRRITLRRSI